MCLFFRHVQEHLFLLKLILACSISLAYTYLVTVCAEANPEALKLWFLTRKGVRTHGEPNLKGFLLSATVTDHDRSGPTWAAI